MPDTRHDETSRYVIRRYRDEDEPALRSVCVKTGKSGGDATDWIPGGLLPDIYLSPYVRYAPDLATVVDGPHGPCGYIVAVGDTAAFVAWYREHWLPRFRAAHPLIEPPRTTANRLTRTGYHPEGFLGPDQDLFPAHMHIDLLPMAQGRGLGRLLIRRLLSQLRMRGVAGVQLGVGESNHRARRFYEHIGFRPLPTTRDNPLQLCIGTDEEV